mmetsp:Transcript_1582/g.4601  ORF Transcript_1582/g.4601 Transcript_1582/m.4601 type:complete len:395 (-) Transcript_1582:1400-2584(-)
MSSAAVATPPPPAGVGSSTPGTTSHQQQPPLPSGQNPHLSPAEMRYIIEGCVNDMRSDGRSVREFRPYGITPSSSSAGSSVSTAAVASSAPLVLSNGSSRVTLPGSDTDVLCSVRAELVVPSALHPSEGAVELNVDLLPSAASIAGGDNRRRRTEEMEITAILADLLLPHVVDLSALCVIPGKYVWRLNVDVMVLTCDGNVVDVCALAIRSAIRSTVLPQVTAVAKAGADNDDGYRGGGGGGSSGKVSDDFVVDGDIAKASLPPGANNCPVVVTVFVLDKERGRNSGGSGGSVFIVDAQSDEAFCSSTRISVSVDPAGNICGIYKHGSAPALGDEGNYSGTLQVGRLMELTNLAASTSKAVVEMMDVSSAVGGGVDAIGGANSDDLLKAHFELR